MSDGPYAPAGPARPAPSRALGRAPSHAGAAPADPARVFDRALHRTRRDRAAARLAADPKAETLLAAAAERLLDRLDDVTRRFTAALDLGARHGLVAAALRARGIASVVAAELSPRLARMAAGRGVPALAADEEALPFAAGSFDLILSNLSLHWVNDLPGALLQLRHALRPDGLFVATLWGLGTLAELRGALLEAESEATGGAAPRVSPFPDLRDAAGLLQRAGFALPVADAETLSVLYPDVFALFADIRAMGETNAVAERSRRPLPRGVLMDAVRRYAARHATAEGRIPATFRLITLTGWAPHESQQRPLRPGSAAARLADALGTEERSAGEKAGR
ncbi:MAG: methyltransferase domain-containing protein [Alphaproteobacteria bacterium]|nr:methyltransferase domain-containing protein [Alphaproteobacteria bacterium]